MRVRTVIVALLSTFAIVATAWEKEDHELFDLVGALEASEGKGTTFYTFLNITKSATTAEINKAARRRSLELHPDKNPGDKTIEERFARLGLIAAILRDDEKRKRYNFFHDNGVPKWKGTGYMYSRWQPGLGFAISFILWMATLAQYGIQHVTYRLELSRIDKFRRAAQITAYGTRKTDLSTTSSTPTTPTTPQREVVAAVRRKVKVPLSRVGGNGLGGGEVDDDDESNGSTVGATGSSRATRRRAGGAGSGQTITMVVEGDRVWIVTETGEELPLDATAAAKPSLLRTFVPLLLKSGISKLFHRAAPGSSNVQLDSDIDATDVDCDVRQNTAVSSGAEGGAATGLVSTAKPNAARKRKGTRANSKK